MYEDLDIFSQHPLQRYYKEEDIIDHNRQLENAKVQGDLQLERITYKKLGAAHWSLGHYKMAVGYFEKFLPMVRETGDKKSEANTIWNLGITYHSLAQFPNAIRFYKESLKLSKELDRKKCAERMYENLGNAYRSDAKYQKAISFYKLSLSIAKNERDKKSEGRLCTSLGLTFKMQGKYKEAIGCFDDSQHIAQQMRDKVAEADACSNLGKVYMELENYHEALKKFKKSLHINTSSGNTKAVSHALLNLGNGNFSLGRYDEAKRYYTESLNRAEETEDRGRAYGGLGDVHHSERKYDDAIEHYQISLKTAMETQDRNDQRHAHDRLGDVYQSSKEYNEARTHYQKSLSTAMEMNDKKNEGRAHGKLGQTFRSLENCGEAIEHYKKNISAAKLINDTMAEGKANRALGDVYHSLNHYSKAKNCYIEYSKNANQSHDLKSKQNAYNILGNFYQSRHEYGEAIGCHKNSLDLARESKDLKGKGEAYMLLGDDNQLLKKYNDAIQCYKESLMMYKKLGDQANKRKVNEKLGFLCQLTNNYKEAITYYKQALEVNIPIEKEGERELHKNLGVAYLSLHKYELAIQHHEKSLSIAIEMSDEKAQMSANSNLGNTYLASGNCLKALEYFKKNNSTEDSSTEESTEDKGNAYEDLGNVYYVLGEYIEARKYYMKYLEVAKGLRNTKMTMTAHSNLGKVCQKLGEKDDSISHFEKGLDIAEKTEKGKSYGNLGKCCYHFKEYSKAIFNHSRQCHESKEIHNKVIEGDAYANWANACLAKNEPEEYRSAKECLKSFEKIKFKDEDMKELVETYSVIGVVYRKVARYYKDDVGQVEYYKSMEQSKKFLKKSMQLSEHQIHNLKDQDHFKISFLDTFSESYKQLTVSLIQTKKSKEALLVCDSGRARALRDRLISKYGLTNQNTGQRYSLQYPSIANALKKGKYFVLFHALTQDLTQITMSVLPNQQEPICFLENESNTEGRMEETIHEIVYRAYDEIGVSDKRDRSDDSKPENSFETQCYQPQGACNRETTTDLVVTTLPQRNAKNKSAKARENALKILFERLVAPALNLKLHYNLEEVVVIPDGLLNIVPYAALIDQSGKYLSETMQIRLAPSLTTLKTLQECPKSYHCKTGALVIGICDVGKTIYKGIEVNREPLPSAEKEAEKIGELLNATALLGSDATKDVVKEKLQEGVAVIHIATHGLYEYGEIVLAPSAAARANGRIPDEQDYILTVKEVQDMGLRAQLVVLSCCFTGRGDIKAEGMIGMCRAFLAAGARAVVAALWGLDDKGTSYFMERFYSYLNEGKSASLSLQQAMADMRRNKDYVEPRYWAPFFLIGDNVKIK